jgi:fibrillarin-like pre-rRNA processing protein
MSNILRTELRGKEVLLTKNFAPGRKVYGEEFVIRKDGEYRRWDPFRSKLGAAILKGLDDNVIKEGDWVLYLGTSTGTTPSHISDIIGSKGVLIGVEFAPRVAREFIENVARPRKNVVPYVEDARHPERYSGLGRVDVVYCDIAQQDQTEIAIDNCEQLLKPGGTLLLVVKSRSIDVIKEPSKVFREEEAKLRSSGFDVREVVELSPFDKDHAIIRASNPPR